MTERRAARRAHPPRSPWPRRWTSSPTLATRAGADPQAARQEALSMAAAVAESAPRAADDWGRAAGHERFHPGLLRRRQSRAPLARLPHGDPQRAGRRALAARRGVRQAPRRGRLGRVPARRADHAGHRQRLRRRRGAAARRTRVDAARRRRRRRRPGHADAADPVAARSAAPEPQAGHGDPRAEHPEKTLEELMAELDGLIGLERVKREIHRQVARAARREAARRGRPAEADHHPPPRLHRQPRHRQDHRGPPGQRHLPRPRPAVEGPARRGRPLRAGGRLPRPDRDEDRRCRRLGRGRGALHRRGLQPDRDQPARRPVRPGGRRHPGQGDGGPSRRPRRHRGRLPRADAGLHQRQPRVWRAGSGPRSSSRTTPTTSSSRSCSSSRQGADYELVPEAVERFREVLGRTPRGDTFGNGRFARNALEAAIGQHAWRLRDIESPTLDQLRQLVARDFDEEPLEEARGFRPRLRMRKMRPQDPEFLNRTRPREADHDGHAERSGARARRARARRRPHPRAARRRRSRPDPRPDRRDRRVRALRLRGHPGRLRGVLAAHGGRGARVRAARGVLVPLGRRRPGPGPGQHRPADPGPGDPEPRRPGRCRRHQRLPGRRARTGGPARRLHRGHQLGLQAHRRGRPAPAGRRQGAGRAQPGAGQLRDHDRAGPGEQPAGPADRRAVPEERQRRPAGRRPARR